MSLFEPRVFPEIMGGMVARLISATPLTDVNFGSVFTTLLEAAATEDDEQYFQMLEIIRGYSLDTTSGDDLDARAQESVGDRLTAQQATSVVTVSDTAVTKVETGTYSGLAGAIKDQTFIYGDEATGFSAAGDIVIGRDTANAETVAYTSIDQFTNYVRFNLGAGLANDHGTDETIIMSQGGNRSVPAGIVVYIPESDISERVEFTIDENYTILDGESEVTDVRITASTAGADANAPIGAIQEFDSAPFPTASVRNPGKITNGLDVETDQELRDRIKDHIQSLSRGTKTSITTGINGLVSSEDNKRVVSSSLVEPTIPADVVKLYIDDGSGTIFDFSHAGVETILTSATGGEKFLKVGNTPMVKAFVETQNTEPFNLVGGEQLFVDVGGEVETVIFVSTDFETPGEATAQEVLAKINASASFFESRVSSNGTQVRVFSRSNSDEEIRVTGGTANTILAFPTDTKFTSRVYLTRDNVVSLLSKDGRTATIEAGNTEGYDLGTDFIHLTLAIDGKYENLQHIRFNPTVDFVNPNSVTVDELVPFIEARVSGLTVQSSSNGNKFRFVSLTQRSLSSEIRIIENFTDILNEEAGVNIDRKADIQSAGVDTEMFATNLDYAYFFHDTIKTGSLFVKMTGVASANLDLALEYWNGTSWIEIGFLDTTVGFTQDGHIFFPAPFDWAITTVDGKTGYAFRLQRNQALAITAPQVNRIRVCGANEAFGFSETEVIGANKDYTLNRFIGQLELETPLQVGDKLEIGTFSTRAQSVTGASGNYGGLVGTALEITVDGVLQSYTFVAGDFFDTGSALATEVATAINSNFTNIVASSSDGLVVEVLSNRYNNGSLIFGGTANAILQFPTNTLSSLEPHVPAIESGAGGPFAFQPDDSLIIIVDGNLSNVFDAPLYHKSTLTGFTDVSNILDSALNTIFTVDDDIAGFDIEITAGPEVGARREIVSYTASTGNLQLDAPLGGDPGLNEYYIIPKTSKQVATLWGFTKVTLLSTRASAKEISGDKLQIASLAAGEEASIQVSGGAGNTLLLFDTDKILGVDSYRYYTGLPQQVQWTVDGKDDDDAFDGIRAAGVQVEVAEPVTIPIDIQLDVTPQEGTTLSSITTGIKSAVSGYVNQLGVGEDVVVSDIIVVVKEVVGVFDVDVALPTANLAMADNQQARVNENDISVG